jgi:outer membrane protein TolC
MARIPLAAMVALVLSGCMRDASHPFDLAPATPYAAWTERTGNCLVSSRYCKTILPNKFETTNLSLAELIDIALQNNPTTRQTWANARSAAASYSQSLSNFLPNIGFQGQYLRQKYDNLSQETAIDFYFTQAGPNLNLTYTLFDFGQRSSQATSLRESLFFADLNHNQQIQIVIQNVMDDYYNYLYALSVLRANEADLQNAQSSLDAANERFSLGLAALGDVAQARTQYLQSKIALTTQKQNVLDAYAQLCVDLGLPANTAFKVEPMPEQVIADVMLENVDSLVAQAQMQRQDFLATQANIRSKEALVVNAKRASLPIVNSQFQIGHYEFQNGLAEKNFHWSGELSLSFPIFAGFFYTNGVRIAEANLEQAKAQMLQTELGVIQNVTTAHMEVKTSAQNLTDTDEYLKAAELEFNIALSTYKAGTATILDLLSAQSFLSDARAKKAGAKRDWFTALASLAYATGSLCATPACGENSCE